MASNYPGSLDSFDTIASDKKTSDSVGGRTHRAMHNDLGDAIEAVQAELGVNPSGSAATVVARLSAIEAGTNLATGAVTSAKIADGTVGASELADNAVNVAALDADDLGNGLVLTADDGEPSGMKWSAYGIADLDIGTVDTGTPAAASMTGTPQDGYALNLTLPPVGDGSISNIAVAADADIARTKIAGTALTAQSTGIFSVKDFGAVGDGTTDDTAAVHAARDAAGENGTVWFPPGTYKMNVTMNVDGQVWWLAEGAVGRCNNTGTAIVTIDASNVELRGGTLQGDMDWEDADGTDTDPLISGNVCVKVQSASGQTRENITIREVALTLSGYRALFGKPGAGGTISNAQIIGCRFIENHDAFNWWCSEAGELTEGLVVRDCYFDKTWLPATHQADNATVLGGNYIRTTTGLGTIADMLIENNHLSDNCGRMGIELWAADATVPNWVTWLTIRNNYVGQAWHRTFSVGALESLTITGNEIVDFYTYCEMGASHIAVENNVFVGAMVWPKSHARGEGAGTIRNNVFHMIETTAAIKIWFGGRWTITDNEIYLRPDVRGHTLASDLNGYEVGDVLSFAQMTGVELARNYIRYEGVMGRQHFLQMGYCQNFSVVDNVWHVAATASQTQVPTDSAYIQNNNGADNLFRNNRIHADIQLMKPSCIVREQTKTESVVRRSWSGTEWVDKTLTGFLNTPPSTPSAGDEYLVGDDATDAWVGHEASFAEWNGAAWDYREISQWVWGQPPSNDIYWVDTTPETGTVGDHIAIPNKSSMRNTYVGNDWEGLTNGGFRILYDDKYYLLGASPASIFVDNIYDAATRYGAYGWVVVNQDVGYALGFYGATPVVKPAVSGARDEPEGALASLITQLAALGLITDSTTAS